MSKREEALGIVEEVLEKVVSGLRDLAVFSVDGSGRMVVDRNRPLHDSQFVVAPYVLDLARAAEAALDAMESADAE